MSDQTQDSPGDTATDTSEPSMEDILASIRRIIAEDDAEEAANDTPAVVETASSEPLEDDDDLLELSEELILDEEFEPEDLSIPEIEDATDVDIDVETEDDLLLSMDDLVLDTPALEEAEVVGETEAEDIIDLVFEDAEEAEDINLDMETDDIDIFDDLDLTLDAEDPVEDIVMPSPSAEVVELDASGFNEDEDREAEDLLNEFLDDIAEKPLVLDAPEPVIEVIPGTVQEDIDLKPELKIETAVDDSDEDIVMSMFDEDDRASVADETPDTALSETDSDIDLVKSLMADLTDDTFLDEDTSSDDILELVESDRTDFEVAKSDASDEQDAILDDILELAMDDEIATTQVIDDPLLSADVVDVEAPTKFSVADPLFDEAPDTGSSILLDIAAAAEADAELVQIQYKERREEDVSDLDNAPDDEPVNEAEESLFEDLTEDVDDNVDVETEDDFLAELEDTSLFADDVDDILEEIEETPDMPKTAKSDAILDEVTESAAADAFASLNQAVEEKVAVKEAGPPIGDLVQEALKPMLKEWLDENLKDIVERAVQKEVKRISSRK